MELFRKRAAAPGPREGVGTVVVPAVVAVVPAVVVVIAAVAESGGRVASELVSVPCERAVPFR